MADDFGPEQFDFDLLRNLGLLPPSIGGANLQPSPLPVIDTGPRFGPAMEAELGAPYGMPPAAGEDRVPVSPNTEDNPAATMPQAGPSFTGTASFTKALPGAVGSWMQRQLAEKESQKAAIGRRAQAQANEDYRREALANEIRVNQANALRELARTNPQAFLQHAAQIQAAQAKGAAGGAGSAEAQAFREIQRTQGLDTALQWLQTAQRGPLTPEQRFTNTLAETMGRFGPDAQALRAQNAQGVSAASAIGKGTPEALLTPAESQKYGVPYGTTRQQVMGTQLTSEKQRQPANELETGRYMMDHLSGLADELITASTPTDAAMQGFSLRTSAFLKSNPRAAVYQDQRQALLGIISRQVGAERGVLTDRDIYRIDNALPHFRDTREIKDQKLRFLRGMFDVSREARLKAMSQLVGEPVGQQTTPTGGQRTQVDTLPPASQYSGKTATVTGKRFRSNGVDWVEIR